MDKEIRRRAAESRGDAARAIDALRQSMDRHAEAYRQQREEVKRAHAERVRKYWRGTNVKEDS